MSAAAPARPASGPAVSADAIAIVAALVVVLGAMLYFATGRNPELSRSPTGFDGLAIWLADGGVDARSFQGGWTIPAEEVGLEILPIYDAALDAPRARPETEEALLMQRDEIDMNPVVLREKAEMAPTLLILPKWRSGMRLSGIAHPMLLIAPDDVSSVLRELLAASDAPTDRIRQHIRPFAEYDYRAAGGGMLTARLYLPQTFDGTGCRPVIGRPGEMILGRCRLKTDDGVRWVHVLSDPDLLDNHGLRLGDNAEIARDFIGGLAGTRQVIVDYSRKTWLVAEPSYDYPGRTWADLARFFAFPFSLLWIAAGAALGLFVWRSSVRFGPVRRGETALGASRSVMLAARARLMRLTGQDGALAQACARARLGTAAHRLLGPRSHEPAEAAVLRIARGRDPALAETLSDLLERIRAAPAHLPPETAIGYVSELEILLERLNHDA